MIGHSMGGYVVLDFAEKYSSMLKGFGLLHSHALPIVLKVRKTEQGY